jgi:hypothetical protein
MLFALRIRAFDNADRAILDHEIKVILQTLPAEEVATLKIGNILPSG